MYFDYEFSSITPANAVLSSYSFKTSVMIHHKVIYFNI